jgi:hypothetical protein
MAPLEVSQEEGKQDKGNRVNSTPREPIIARHGQYCYEVRRIARWDVLRG